MTSTSTRASTSAVPLARDAASPLVGTRALLALGVVAGPLFLATVLAQAAAHDDFDLRVHPLSSLALGAQGWVQTASFVVTGLAFVAFAIGLRRRLHPGRGGTWAPILVAVNGLSLVVAGLFAGDPINGYPVGAAEGATLHGVIHSAGPAVGGLAGYATLFVLARRYAGLGRRGWAVASVAVLPADLVLTAVAMATGDFRYMVLGLGLGYAWTSAVALDLLRSREAWTSSVRSPRAPSARSARRARRRTPGPGRPHPRSPRRASERARRGGRPPGSRSRNRYQIRRDRLW